MKLQRMTYPSRIERAPAAKGVICRFWMQGKCNRNPCRFEHGDVQFSNVYHKTSRPPHGLLENVVRKIHKTLKTSNTAGFGSEAAKKSFNTVGSRQNISNSVTKDFKRKHFGPRNVVISTILSNGSKDEVTKKIDVSATNEVNPEMTEVVDSDPCNSVVLVAENPDFENRTKKTAEVVCEQRMSGTCGKGDDCLNLHSRFSGEGFFMRAELRGHNQAISGITLPTGSDKLYSSSGDGTVQIWNCHTGESARVINLGNKIGSMISEGPWLFAGTPNLVKAMNTETAADYDLIGSGGQVYALAIASDMLFVGAEDGAIAVWKCSMENPCPFRLDASLNGHTGAVICFAVEARTLFSGSMDGTIRVWELETLQCLQTLNGHTDAVTSLIWWNGYLMSCSLDHTIKAWFSAQGNNFENVYAHNEEHGALALCGINDAENKPILMCSCNDNSVHLYEIPTFKERGRLFSKEEVRTIQMGPYGLFFTGDGTGLVTVWEFSNKKVETS